MSYVSKHSIDTKYNGYRFRSRLEARWAVFFETMKLRFEYEKEGYAHNNSAYLPDFYLPELDIFVEVKGTEEVNKLNEDIKKIANNIYWGGGIKQIVIVPNIPPVAELGLWNFPALKYDTWANAPVGCWFKFCDINDEKGGGILIDSSFKPFEIGDEIKGQMYFENGQCIHKPLTVQPLSSWELAKREITTRLIKMTYEELEHDLPFDEKEDAIFECKENLITMQAYDVARQKRFEHGKN